MLPVHVVVYLFQSFLNTFIYGRLYEMFISFLNEHLAEHI